MNQLSRRPLRRQRSTSEAQEASAPTPLKVAIFGTGQWKVDILVAHGSTQDHFIDYLNETFISADGGPFPYPEFDVLGFTLRQVNDGGGIFVWIENLSDLEVLTHELMHVAFGVLLNRGLTLSGDSEEAFCYLVDDLQRRIRTSRQWSTYRLPRKRARG